MHTAFRIVSEPNAVGPALTAPANYTQLQAVQANDAFDRAVQQFLRHWLDAGTVSGLHDETETGVDAFIETGALRSFFKHHDDALELLLDDAAIARHLLRPADAVFFWGDAYEPLLARFERRIYNLAAHREHREVPFRYCPPSRQGDFGDTPDQSQLPVEDIREDIGTYFGTRRSDATALNILGDQLRRETLRPAAWPIVVVTEGYMTESLQRVRTLTEEAADKGDTQRHCFIVQRRHAPDDRHLGAALLVMDPARPDQPRRVMFCDTLNPNGTPPWWNKFKEKVDAVFPQSAGQPPASDRLEDGGVNLQRLHDGVPVRHQDIDCAFYTASMCRALIQTAQQFPELIQHGSINDIVSEMTARMPEYFDGPDQAKDSVLVREVNVMRRWNTGREALQNLMPTVVIDWFTSAAAMAELA